MNYRKEAAQILAVLAASWALGALVMLLFMHGFDFGFMR